MLAQEGVFNLLHVCPESFVLLKNLWVGLCSEANLSLVVALTLTGVLFSGLAS